MLTFRSVARLCGFVAVVDLLPFAVWRTTHGMASDLLGAIRPGALESPRTTLDGLVADLAALLLLVAAVGLAVVVTSSAAAVVLQARSRTPAATPTRWSRLVAPTRCCRLIALVCGIGLATPLWLGTAVAEPGAAPAPCVHTCVDPLDLIAGLPLPDQPASGLRGPSRPLQPATARPLAHRPSPDVVRVRAGDSLWAIARSLSPADATDADIAVLTQRLYLRNRSTVGPDPDLILPGMTLHTPKGTR